MFCEHNRDYCHTCRIDIDYRHANCLVEEDASLRRKETGLEKVARMCTMTRLVLLQIESMSPRPSEARFGNWRMLKQLYTEQISMLIRNGASDDDVQLAFG